jgi:hypothetical protein
VWRLRHGRVMRLHLWIAVLVCVSPAIATAGEELPP